MNIQNTDRDTTRPLADVDSTQTAQPETAPPPWPVPVAAPVLMFGGSFDPPHAAHIELARTARGTLCGTEGWLVYVPAARSPHKATGPAASDAQRLDMLRLALQGDDHSVVWTEEIVRARREGADAPSYWVDTLERAHTIAPQGTNFRFLIGADQALAFPLWHEWERILQLAEPAVLLREPCNNHECFRRQLLESGMDPAEWMPRVIDTELHRAASTNIRSILASGHEPGDIIDPLVLEYITNHGLYTESP